MEESELSSGIPTETQGSCSPFEISAAQEGESMDQTQVIYTEQGTTELSESVEEELVLPRLRVRFQDETSSEVRLQSKIFRNIFMMCTSFFSRNFSPRSTSRFALWALSQSRTQLVLLAPICHVIGARSRWCPITGVRFELFVIGYL